MFCRINFQQDITKPVTDLPFPSVTICSPGLNMDAVEEALVDVFEDWLASEGKTGGSLEDRLAEFMEETFATSGNIFETIKAMNIPSASDERDTSALLQKMIACEATDAEEGRSKRRKREQTMPESCKREYKKI